MKDPKSESFHRQTTQNVIQLILKIAVEMKVSLLGWLRTILKAHHPSDTGNPTDDKILRFICPCPACGKEVVERGDGHSYALLASEIAREESQDLKHFFQLYKSRNWVDLNQIQRFEGAFNAALVYVVQCTGGITLIAVRSPVELYEDDSLLDAVVLDESEATTINCLPVTFKNL